MDRSRSKRNYYYDQDYDSENLIRSSTKPRYNHHQFNNNNGHHYRRGGGGGGARSGKGQEPPGSVTTNYRILCHDMKAGGVIGKSGSIIKTIRQHTGAWINVHELVPGDEERVIEISDTRRRDPDGRMPAFSPAQEALFMIHERILESNDGFGIGNFDDGDDYGFRHGVNRVVSRLVVSRMHVGSLLGKGGKIIEQMRMETKTHIRVLPRDNTLPRCVSMSEEIVQVVGDINNVKNAIAIISSRIRESQHRDRSHHQGRMNSPDERFFPPDDDLIPYQNNTPRRSSMDGPSFGSQQSGLTNINRNDNYASRTSDYNSIDSGPPPMVEDAQPSLAEGIVLQILCPIDKIDCIVGDSDGIMDLLRDDIGVDITVTDSFPNSNERIIIIYSEEGPDNEMFPAQEALLHIQTRIVDLVQDKENIITTRIIIPSSDIGCLKDKDGSLSDMSFTGANIHILPKEQFPAFIMPGTDEIVQITGEIQAARNAIIEVTSRLRSYIFRDLSQKGMLPMDSAPSREVDIRNNQPTGTTHQPLPETAAAQLPKVTIGSTVETPKPSETDHREVVSSVPNRTVIPLVTRSILEVVLPDYAIPKLITRSKNKLAQISELSGANIKLVEDGPESTEKIIQISGTPEQAERAQSLLQGFILSSNFLSLYPNVCISYFESR